MAMITRAVGLLRIRLSALARSVHAPRWVSLCLIAVTLACAAGLIWLVYDAALDKNAGLLGKALLFGIGLLAAVATVAVSWEPEETPPLQRLTSPWGAGLVLMAVLTAFGAMTDALSWFEPRNATTDDTGRIEAQGDEILSILRRRFPDEPPILSEISGRWGEPDCALVWDISIIERGGSAALVAALVTVPDNMPDRDAAIGYRLLAEIIAAEDNRMTVSGVEPASAEGSTAVFTLNAATGRLLWDDRRSASGVEEYQRCPAQ
jgi:hypothetical protein